MTRLTWLMEQLAAEPRTPLGKAWLACGDSAEDLAKLIAAVVPFRVHAESQTRELPIGSLVVADDEPDVVYRLVRADAWRPLNADQGVRDLTHWQLLHDEVGSGDPVWVTVLWQAPR